MANRTPVQQSGYVGPVPFQFGLDFQAKLVKVLLLDRGGADAILDSIRPEYFENPQLRWMVDYTNQFRKRYNQIPSWTVLLEEARGMEVGMREVYTQAIEHIRALPIKEEEYIKERVLDWTKRNIFVAAHQSTRALFNAGKVAEAYDLMRKAMDSIDNTSWERPDRGYFFEEFGAREARRTELKQSEKIGSGIAGLDHLLGGGLGPTEMGCWVAYSKGGKSVMLVNHGVACTRSHFKKCLHFVLEGKRAQCEDRYDSCFTGEVYTNLKQGNMDATKYGQAWEEYQYLKGLLIVRGLTENWRNTILDIDTELKDLRRSHGWIPDMVVIDYGDLINGRDPPYESPWMSERDAYRDMKTLAMRGDYVLWTAAQAQKPKVKNYLNVEHVLNSSDIAGGTDKIRVSDYIGSINSTMEERQYNQMRLSAELYRDAAVGELITCGCDFSRMRFGLPVKQEDVLGYGKLKESKAIKKGKK